MKGNSQYLAITRPDGEEVTWAEAVKAVWAGEATPDSYELIVRWRYGEVDSTEGSVGPQNLFSKPHGNTKGAPE